jgi:predicted GIY-YIG superfamily endonuclease
VWFLVRIATWLTYSPPGTHQFWTMAAPQRSDFVVYLICSGTSRSYVGITKNLPNRLRQHCGEIQGGARATRGRDNWRLVARISGLKNDRQVRQLEYRLHHPVQRHRGGTPLDRRMRELCDTFWLPNVTSGAEPLAGITIDWMTAEACEKARALSKTYKPWPEELVARHFYTGETFE